MSNIPKMIKLGPILVGDIHSDFMFLVPEEPCVPVHSLGGGTGVKLNIECVPDGLGRGENFHNVRQFSDIIFHLKLKIFEDEEFHSILDVISLVDSADIINITFDEWLEAHCALCCLGDVPEG